MKVSVINVRGLPTREPRRFIYVGRAMPGLYAGHPLGNPFKLKARASDEERAACLEKYREWLRKLPGAKKHLAALAEEVLMTGLPLGCWCAPKMCHADVLAELVQERLDKMQRATCLRVGR